MILTFMIQITTILSRATRWVSAIVTSFFNGGRDIPAAVFVYREKGLTDS